MIDELDSRLLEFQNQLLALLPLLESLNESHSRQERIHQSSRVRAALTLSEYSEADGSRLDLSALTLEFAVLRVLEHFGSEMHYQKIAMYVRRFGYPFRKGTD